MRRMVGLSVGSLVWLLSVGVVCGREVPFAGLRAISATNFNAAAVQACDLDGDGDLDVVFASPPLDLVGWYENLGGGGFAASQPVGGGDGADTVWCADIDGDDDLDVLAGSWGDGRIAWHENAGGGSFSASHDISWSEVGAKRVRAADLDGDGDLDVVTAANLADVVAWYDNLGAGSFGTRHLLDSGVDARWVATGDLDGDDDADVLAANGVTGSVTWYENLGGGSFGGAVALLTGIGTPTAVAAGDMDGDGDLDVVAASSYSQLALLENLGGASFAAPVWFGYGGAESLVLVDLDGDGDLDALVAHSGGAWVAWYDNLGDGGFEARTVTAAVFQPRSAAAGDVDGDGDLDVLSASESHDTVAWTESLWKMRDRATFEAWVGAELEIVDFEGIASVPGQAGAVALGGDELLPLLALRPGPDAQGLYVGIPDGSIPGGNAHSFYGDDLVPTSGVAVLAPDLVPDAGSDEPDGVVVVNLVVPSRGLGVSLLDAEAVPSYLEAFAGPGGAGASLGRVVVQNEAPQAFAGIGAPGIQSAILQLGRGADGVAIDDLSFAVPVPSGSFQQGVCGQTVTEAVLLTEDIGPCPGDGLVVAASDVVVDGNGFRLSGSGGASGVVVDGVDRVTVQRFIVAGGFETGIEVGTSSDSVVRQNVVVGNDTGLVVGAAASGLEVEQNQLSHSSALAISCQGSGNTFASNLLYANGAEPGSPAPGTQVQAAAGNVFERNYWGNYWGVDDGSGGGTAGDWIGDTMLPHEGLDAAPLLDPGLVRLSGFMPCGSMPIPIPRRKEVLPQDDTDWWTASMYLVWRGGWSPVELSVTDPLGRVLSPSVNQIGGNAFCTSTDEVTPGHTLAQCMVAICGGISSDGWYTFEMRSLEPGKRLTYWLQHHVSDGEPTMLIDIADGTLAPGEIQLVLTRLSSEIDPVTGNLVVVAELPLFADGFESGDTSAWSQSVP